MKEKANLTNVHPSKVFTGYIYPVFAKDFLFMNKYEDFASMVQLHFLLTGDQWQVILDEWQIKESILNTSIQ